MRRVDHELWQRIGSSSVHAGVRRRRFSRKDRWSLANHPTSCRRGVLRPERRYASAQTDGHGGIGYQNSVNNVTSTLVANAYNDIIWGDWRLDLSNSTVRTVRLSFCNGTTCPANAIYPGTATPNPPFWGTQYLAKQTEPVQRGQQRYVHDEAWPDVHFAVRFSGCRTSRRIPFIV